MGWGAKGAAFVAIVTAGCAQVPKPQSEIEGVSPEFIVRRVQCELATAYTRYGKYDSKKRWLPFIDALTVRTDLTLQVVDQNIGGLGATLAIPVFPDTLGLDGALGYDNTSTMIQMLAFETQMSDLRPLKNGDTNPAAKCPNATGFAPAGSDDGLGLEQWIDSVERALLSDSARADLVTASYQVKFTLIKTAGGGIGFTTSRITASGARTSFKHTNENTLVVAVAEKTVEAAGQAISRVTGKPVARSISATVRSTGEILDESIRQQKDLTRRVIIAPAM